MKEVYMDWSEVVNSYEKSFTEILSFPEYMEVFEKEFQREIRTTSMYLKDLFDFYGTDDQGGFKLFKRETSDSPPLAGQRLVQQRIYQNLINFAEEGFNNKFLLLVGPNGSSKSSIIKKIMLAAEDYSKKTEGALYSFSWVFPIDHYTKGSLGLSSKDLSKKLESFAHLDDTDISAILDSPLKDHPFLLLPLEVRRKMLDEKFEDFPDKLSAIKQTFLYNGDISKRNRLIFDALLKNYKGNYHEVLKHIRVERFYIDRRYSTGAATIEPQLHVDAKLQQITMDRRLSSLPPSLQSLNLFSMQGEVILANRGILEYSDLLKRPLDTFKYLLMTMENKTINLQGILTELDIFFVGSSNEVHFNAFKQHPDFNSFKGRFSFLKVPYLLNFAEEITIYENQIQNLNDKCYFEPHAVEALCLWSVMTRMRNPQSKNYKDKRLGDIVAKISPIEKALFLAKDVLPEYLTQEEKQFLRLGKIDIEKEFEGENLYEGKFGISPREIKQVIYDLAAENDSVTFLEVIDYLQDLSEKKSEHDFLNISSMGDYHNPKKFLYFVEHYFLNQFDIEVRDSLGLVDNRSYEDYIAKYVAHINALIKNEKIRNDVTGKFEEPDNFFIKEFEGNIHLKENPSEFRSHVLSKLGAYSLDNPGEKIVYTKVLGDITKQLKETFRNEQKKIIDTVGKNLIYYLEDLEEDRTNHTSINQKHKQQIDAIFRELTEKYSYSKLGAINCFKYLVKKRYDMKK